MLETFARQPLGLTLALAVFPALWMIPADIANETLVPADSRLLGSGRPLTPILVSWGTTAWTSVWYGSQLAAAIGVARDQRASARRYLKGLSHAPAMFVTLFTVGIPIEVLDLLWLPDSVLAQGAALLALFASLFLMIRATFWAPLLIDGRTGLSSGLVASFHLTRGHSLGIVALGAILGAFALPLLVVELLFFQRGYVFGAMLGALYPLAVAELYSLVEGEQLGNQS